jgi:hypothetical protein
MDSYTELNYLTANMVYLKQNDYYRSTGINVRLLKY